MPNIAKNFIQSFDSGYDASARNFEENLHQKNSEDFQLQKEERERQAKLKAQQDAEAKSVQNISAYQNAKPEDKAKALLGLSKDDLTKVKEIDEINKPKKSQTTKGKQVFQSDEAGNIDFTKPPLYTEPEKLVKPSPRILNMPGYDKKTNSFLQKEGIPIDESEKDQYPETMKVGNQLFGVTKTPSHGKPLKVIDQNGKREKEYTMDMHVLNQKYFNTQQNYQRALQTGYKSNGQPLTLEERDQYKTFVNEWNKKYVEHVKDTMPKAATKWYQDLYNKDRGGEKGNPPPDQYLQQLHKDFIDGKFKGVDEKVIMRSLHELYRATYSIDPTGQDYSEAVPEEPEVTPDNNVQDTSND